MDMLAICHSWGVGVVLLLKLYVIILFLQVL